VDSYSYLFLILVGFDERTWASLPSDGWLEVNGLASRQFNTVHHLTSSHIPGKEAGAKHFLVGDERRQKQWCVRECDEMGTIERVE
jgi:hypothetical protein